jgi:hypothetical protein
MAMTAPVSITEGIPGGLLGDRVDGQLDGCTLGVSSR